MKKVTLKQVSPLDPMVKDLIDQLDQYQIELYGIEQCNLESPETLERSAYMLGAYIEKELAGIGAVKLKNDHAEIKRMFIAKPFRKQGIADHILDALETYAVSHGRSRICLETGNKHKEALHFYQRVTALLIVLAHINPIQ